MLVAHNDSGSVVWPHMNAWLPRYIIFDRVCHFKSSIPCYVNTRTQLVHFSSKQTWLACGKCTFSKTEMTDAWVKRGQKHMLNGLITLQPIFQAEKWGWRSLLSVLPSSDTISDTWLPGCKQLCVCVCVCVKISDTVCLHIFNVWLWFISMISALRGVLFAYS